MKYFIGSSLWRRSLASFVSTLEFFFKVGTLVQRELQPSFATSLLMLSICQVAGAEILPDSTLGVEQSQVSRETIRGLDSDRITGGARRGANLFHSFRQFDLEQGRGAYFDNPTGVERILMRVTGGDRSEILGRLGVLGEADLFVLNPNGIIFGQGASLDMRGSFLASTAGSIVFRDGTVFSATNPQALALLTLSTPIGLQYGNQPTGTITLNQSELAVNAGQSIILAGGDITVDNSSLRVDQAAGGRIELASVKGTGTLGLNINDLASSNPEISNPEISNPASLARLSLSFPTDLPRATMQIRNRSTLSVVAANQGSLALYADNLDITGASTVEAGIATGLGSASRQAGDISIDLTGVLQVRDASTVKNQVAAQPAANEIQQQTLGTGGNVRVSADALVITGGSRLDTSTFGQGDAGDVIVNVRDRVVLQGYARTGAGETEQSTPSGISSFVNAAGRGGDLNLRAGSLSIGNGAQLSALTFGAGAGGNVIVNVRDRIHFDGVIPDRNFSSGIVAIAFGSGQGGNVQVSGQSLWLTRGARLFTNTFGQSNAGNIGVNVRDRVRFNGFATINAPGQTLVVASGAFAGVNQIREAGQRRGGNIRITADSIALNRGEISTTASIYSGEANAGDIYLNAETVSLRQGGTISAFVGGGQGNGGDIVIQARDRVLLDGYAVDGEKLNPTGISSKMLSPEAGNGGDIQITAGSLIVTNGGELAALTSGRGNAGNIQIRVRDRIWFDGGLPNLNQSSVAVTGVFSTKGEDIQGGDIVIDAESLWLTNGARLFANTEGQGQAGSITVNVRDRIHFDGYRIIEDGRTFVTSGAFVDIGEDGQGNSGDIHISANSLALTNGAEISAQSRGRGDAGNVRITAREHLVVSGMIPERQAASRITAAVEETGVGRSGSIIINTDRLDVENGGEISVRNLTGQSGNLTINAEVVELERGRLTAATGANAPGRTATINLRDLNLLLLQDHSLISAEAFGKAEGGNVTIEAANGFVVAPLRQNSDIVARAYQGQGGNIQITAQEVYGIAEQPATLGSTTNDIDASSQFGNSGTVRINRPNVDPEEGLEALPEDPIDLADLIDRNLCQATRGSEFIITGRGGLPVSPNEPGSGEGIWEDWRLNSVAELPELPLSQPSRPSARNTQGRAAIVEAQGWIVEADGQVKLVAEAPTTPVPHSNPGVATTCRL